MSTSHSSNSSLLRRPRPPVHQASLPPVVSQKSAEANFSSSRISPPMRPMPSLASHQDGLQSPVPTMQSEYDQVFSSQMQKSKKCQSQHTGSDNTTTGDTGDGSLSKKGLRLPYKPRGPGPFPMREPKHPPDVKREFILPIEGPRHAAEFTLEDFLLNNKLYFPRRSTLRTAMLSKSNYKKLTLLLQKELTQGNQDSVKQIDISQQADITNFQKRIPRRQLLIEMKSVVQDRLKELGLTSPGKFDGRSHDVGQIWEEVKELGDAEGVGRKSQLSLFNKATMSVFKNSYGKHPGSVFDDDNTESIITPSELSILNCLMEGGYVLSLKAHFIPQIPELSPLSSTLVYLNLSFNEFSNFPREVLSCRELQVLKLRNNPLTVLPHDISKLRKLRTLILSFCCLNALPLSLFSLTRLEFFDVSYNKLTFLPNEIKKLERLRFLNVEGNELPGLPCGLLRLNLFRIRVQNNFTSPLLWKENARNNPQRLTDLCLLKVKLDIMKHDAEKMRKFLPEIVRAINNFKPCDCCSGPLYGPGLKIIRPCTEIWGIKRIPFIFQSCSPTCYSRFIHNTDPKVTEIVYGVPEEKVDQDPTFEDDDGSLGRPPTPRDGAITA